METNNCRLGIILSDICFTMIYTSIADTLTRFYYAKIQNPVDTGISACYILLENKNLCFSILNACKLKFYFVYLRRKMLSFTKSGRVCT